MTTNDAAEDTSGTARFGVYNQPHATDSSTYLTDPSLLLALGLASQFRGLRDPFHFNCVATDAPLCFRNFSKTISAAYDRTLIMCEVALTSSPRTRRTVGTEPAALPTMTLSANARKPVELTYRSEAQLVYEHSHSTPLLARLRVW